ncbi:MAG TPA: 4'-phosphopantetheinyl transferase superfamily protein [Chitinophagaceae bacterium]|nr:4'-phosphopantetheinyl transferase superfamily protein [Chitinophagaceae bacterium]
MSLIKHWSEEQDGKQLAFWKIEEPLDFFASQLKGWEIPIARSERRQLEFASSRFLLQELVADFPVQDVQINDKGKPFLPNESLHFSISHSFPYVGVAVSPKRSIGLDVQTYEPKIKRLQDKFLGIDEQRLSDSLIEKITLLWSSKEAAYKWYGEGFMDFKEHMIVQEWLDFDEYVQLKMNFQHPNQQSDLMLQGRMESEFAWACTESFTL